jgi:hypothetical protein
MAIRKLRHWELDRYWWRVSAIAIRESWKVVWGEIRWRSVVISCLTVVLTALLQFRVVGWSSTIENLKIVGTSVGAGLFLFVVFVVLGIARKPCELDVEAAEKHNALIVDNERLQTENTRLRQPQLNRKPAISMCSRQTPLVSLDDGVWRETWDSQAASRALLFHFRNDLHDDNKGTPATGIRAQVYWEYDNGAPGPQLLPACWVDEKCGCVDIPVGVAKRLLIGVRSADGLWYGWANSRMTADEEMQTRVCADLPSEGRMHIRLIGNSEDVWCALDYEWECPMGPYHPKLKQLS